LWRERGTVLTSATRSIPNSRINATNSSTERVEWPTV
jgi:hypothetical protein